MIFNYITTNKINGKRYVGSHEGDFMDGYLGSGKALKLAIKKYGKENFTRGVLSVSTTKKEAFYNERFLIEIYKTLTPNGYNLSKTGGDFCRNTGELNCTSRAVLQYSKQGGFIRRWGSISDVGRCGIVSAGAITVCFYTKRYIAGNYIWIPEDVGDVNSFLKKIIKSIKEKAVSPHYFSKPVLQYSLEGNFIKEWEGGSVVQRELGTIQSVVSACARGQIKTAGGCIWIFKDKHKDIKAIHKEVRQMAEKGKFKPIRYRVAVLQYSLNGDYLKEWEGIVSAVEGLGLDHGCNTGITGCAKGKNTTAHGFIWKYKKEGDAIEKISKEVKKEVLKREKRGHLNSKPIIQYSGKSEFIKEWRSVPSAAAGTGILRSAIGNCVCGIAKTSGGYKWGLKIK